MEGETIFYVVMVLLAVAGSGVVALLPGLPGMFSVPTAHTTYSDKLMKKETDN